MKRRARLGNAARRRIRAGGPLAKGRPAATLAQWRKIVTEVKARAQERCEVKLHVWFCYTKGGDPHHVVKRSAGGADHPDNVVWLCRAHHNQTDAAYAKGRLIIGALGSGRFMFRVDYASDKHAARREGLIA